MFLPRPRPPEDFEAVADSLSRYMSLQDYGIAWSDSERVTPEVWLFHPEKRFTYLAHLSLYSFALQFIEGGQVLDLGCGMGYGSHYLASRGNGKVTAIDIDDRAIRYARDRYENDRVTYLLTPVESLAEDKSLHGQFDFVYCSNVMEHIADYNAAHQAIKKLLAPKGKYLQITPPHEEPGANPYHVSLLSVPEWIEVLSPLYSSTRCFSHRCTVPREDINNEFEFVFEPCDPSVISISGIILGES